MSSSDQDNFKTSTDQALLNFFRELEKHPYQFGFFSTLRRIECSKSQVPRLGQSVKPSEDCIRLGQEPTLAFAPSQLAKFESNTDEPAARLSVYGPGLFGPNGALPIHLTEFVRERQRNHSDESMWRFVDLFHHRMLSLLYRAWGNSEPVVNADRVENDRFSDYVASLMGLGMESLEHRDSFPDRGRLHYAGHLSRQARSPQGLIGAIENFFGVPVNIQQFVGEWLSIPAREQWKLGSQESHGNLGLSCTLGSAVWSCQHKFKVTIGPTDFATFSLFLPGSENSNRLVALVRSFCGDELEWDLNLVLHKEEVPPCQLGVKGLLGRTAWLHQDQRLEDADDANLYPLSAIRRNNLHAQGKIS